MKIITNETAGTLLAAVVEVQKTRKTTCNSLILRAAFPPKRLLPQAARGCGRCDFLWETGVLNGRKKGRFCDGTAPL